MAKRYLSIDEAAEQLGIAKEELNRLRERGEIRGFADRGTFKFKADDIEELARRMEPSSDPEVPMLVDDDASVFDEPATNIDDAPSFIRNLAANAGEGSGVLDEFVPDGGSSDSDVRLVMDERLEAEHDSGPDVMLQFDESDSDVRLAADSGPNLLADSDSDVRLLAGKGSSPKLSDSDSDVRLSADLPTSPSDSVLKMRFSDSDSDVRLDAGEPSGIQRYGDPDSDSDVMLAPSSAKVGPKPDSDSDVMLVSQDEDSDSDVHLDLEGDGVPIGLQSDSDVQLLAADSDSDVKMLDEPKVGPRSSMIAKKGRKPESDSDVQVLGDESGVALESGGSSVIGGPRSGIRPSDSSVLLEDSEISIGEDSGISLTGKSGISLEEGGSGIALEKVSDSGLSLEHPEADSGLSLFADEESEEDDGITLSDDDIDSGLSLDIDADSGIALEIEADSGIALQSDEQGSDISLDLDEDDGLTMELMPEHDSGIALKEDDGDLQLTETLPTMKMSGRKSNPPPMTDTMLEVPALEEEEEQEESDFEIGTADSGSQADTSVLLFDDEDDSDDSGQAMVKRKKEDTDEESETFDFDQEAEEEEEPAAEDLEGDVFAGDEAFEEEESGESASDYEVAPARVAAAGPVEYPWGMGTVISVGISAVTMLLCAMASIELVRSMWGWQTSSPANGWLITMLSGLIK